MRNRIKYFMIGGLGLLLLSNCAVMHKYTFDPGLGKHFPPPYSSSLQMVTSADVVIDYDIIGEGYGESSGYSLLWGALIHKNPDAMAAYQMAVESQGGDFLVESRFQLQTQGFLAPVLWTKATFKVWGLVGKINQKPETP